MSARQGTDSASQRHPHRPAAECPRLGRTARRRRDAARASVEARAQIRTGAGGRPRPAGPSLRPWASTCRRAGSSSCQATISRAPCSNGDRRHEVRHEAARPWCCRRPSSAPCRRAARRPTRRRRRRWRRTGTCTIRGSTPAARRERRARSASQVSDLVGGDVEGLAERPRVAEQRRRSRGRSRGVRERPQRGAVAVHDDRLARAHPVDDRPAAVEGHERAVVGVRRPHDRHREAARRGRPRPAGPRRRSCRASTARTGCAAASTR